MQGYQLTFYTGENVRHAHVTLAEWLMELAKSLSLRGATMLTATEGLGRDHRFHSAHFIELADQPVEVIMAVTAQEADLLFERLSQEDVSLFYVKIPVEFGSVGLQSGKSLASTGLG